ncbi:hypothetical protein BJ912DRAFT_988864 [Pholiota molesta]|nr:hypothetical protein BJ912DRAFT_988864 [Pholiota molesta]
MLFNNLHMPALRTLSLAPNTAYWKDHRAIPELYSVLKSTPAITTLYLEGGFLSLCTQATPVFLSALEDVEPIWHHAPQLVNLQLRLTIGRYLIGIGFEGIETTIEEAVDLFVCNLFIDDCGWLDLRNPACPVRALMVNDAQIRDFMMSSIQEIVDDAPKVDIHSFDQWWADGVACDVRDRWGARI